MRTVHVLVVVGLLFLFGCDSGGGTAGGRGIDVAYTVDCKTGVTCGNTGDISLFNSGDYRSTTCVWKCSTYKGKENTYVSLSFAKSGGKCWVLDHEYVSDGICY